VDIKIVGKLIDNIQKSSAEEDIATGALATMFELSGDFTIRFLKKVFTSKNNTKLIEKIKKQYEETKSWSCDCGWEISKNAYPWLTFDKKTKFQPDIWLDFSKEGVTKDNEPKKNEGQIFIEAKIDKGTLTEKQKKGYPQLKKQKTNVPFLTLLIDTKKHGENSPLFKFFHEITTWSDVVDISTILLKEDEDVPEVDCIVLNELLEFLKTRLGPEFSLEDYSGNTIERESQLLHSMLSIIKERVNLKSYTNLDPKKWKESYDKENDNEYWCDKDERFKQLYVGDSIQIKGGEKFIVASKSKEGKYFLRLEIWDTDKSPNLPLNNQNIQSIELDFDSKIWNDNWFSLLKNVRNFIEKE